MEKLGRVAAITFAILGFLIILELSMAVHEYGHFTEMRKRGVGVEEFSIGIGWKLAQWQMDGYKLSIRAIPIAAYVKPSKAGEEAIKALPLADREIVYSAGIRNNLLTALALVLLLQLLAVAKKRLSIKDYLVYNVLVAPLMILRFMGQLTVHLLTLGRVQVKSRPFKIPLSDLWNESPHWLLALDIAIFLNFILGLWNLFPFLPLDGGRMFFEVAKLYVSSAAVLGYMEIASVTLMLFYFFIGNFMDLGLRDMFTMFVGDERDETGKAVQLVLMDSDLDEATRDAMGKELDGLPDPNKNP